MAQTHRHNQPKGRCSEMFMCWYFCLCWWIIKGCKRTGYGGGLKGPGRIGGNGGIGRISKVVGIGGICRIVGSGGIGQRFI